MVKSTNTGPVTFTLTSRGALTPAMFVAVTLNVTVPVAAGVPDTIPAAVFTDQPAGRPVAFHAVGEPVAMIW